MFVTNAPLYSTRPVTGWIDVGEPVPLDGGKVAFHFPKDKFTWLSVRGDDTVISVGRDAPGANETFVVEGGTASCMIGEGPRVLGVAAGI